MKNILGITEKNRQKVATELSILLADESILKQKTLNAHWNIEGHDFMGKHLFFEKQNNELSEIIDTVAERIRIIGHYAPASLKDYIQLTTLTEQSRSKNDGVSLITELLNDHESIIIWIKERIEAFQTQYKDLGSSNCLSSILDQHEKMSWFLRSHLK